eukprot:scaffold19528_cov17-Tisochrysis_lutea.AAC.2
MFTGFRREALKGGPQRHPCNPRQEDCSRGKARSGCADAASFQHQALQQQQLRWQFAMLYTTLASLRFGEELQGCRSRGLLSIDHAHQ